MASRVLRNACGLVVSLAAVAFMVTVNAALVVANYMACQVSFYLQGFDAKPLAQEELVGRWLGALAPKATLSHFYALVLAVVVAVGLFWAGHLVVEIVRAAQQRRLATQTGDREEVAAWTWIIIEHSLYLSIVVAVLVAPIRWDLWLFRLRSIAGAHSVENVKQFAQIANLNPEAQSAGGTLVSRLADVGAYGYLCATGLAVLMLELAMKKLSEYFARFMKPADDLLEAWNKPSAGQGESVANHIHEPADSLADDANRNGQPHEGHEGKSLFDTDSPQPESHSTGPEPQPPSQKRPVMGGLAGEEVELAEALRRPSRYHVDGSGIVWARPYWEGLHQTPEAA